MPPGGGQACWRAAIVLPYAPDAKRHDRSPWHTLIHVLDLRNANGFSDNAPCCAQALSKVLGGLSVLTEIGCRLQSYYVQNGRRILLSCT
eukprot:5074429-Pleurochrysis_carterae.AAC.1